MSNSNNRVVHFEIQADDVTRAKSFYEKTFGWQIDQMMTAEQGGMDGFYAARLVKGAGERV